MRSVRARSHAVIFGCGVVLSVVLGPGQVHAQGRDSLVNGTAIGAAVGAGVGVAFTHAVRDSDLTFGQYAYGALIFGAIGGGVGAGVDALLSRVWPGAPSGQQRVVIAPALSHRVKGVAVRWRW